MRDIVYAEDMKRDGRTLDHRTLEAIRRMAVERVREGEDPSTVIASYRFLPHDDLQVAARGEWAW